MHIYALCPKVARDGVFPTIQMCMRATRDIHSFISALPPAVQNIPAFWDWRSYLHLHLLLLPQYHRCIKIEHDGQYPFAAAAASMPHLLHPGTGSLTNPLEETSVTQTTRFPTLQGSSESPSKLYASLMHLAVAVIPEILCYWLLLSQAIYCFQKIGGMPSQTNHNNGLGAHYPLPFDCRPLAAQAVEAHQHYYSRYSVSSKVRKVWSWS